MLIEFLLNVFEAVFSRILSILPTGSLPSEVSSAFTTIATYFQKANAILPVDTLFTLIGLTLTIEFSIVLFNLANYVINKIRGSG